MKFKKRTAVVIVALIGFPGLLLAQGSKVTLGNRTIDPGQYPIIADKEMGQLRWVLEIANQPLDDFTHLEGKDQLGMTSYRYAIAFGTYFLALEQYHKLPAWSEALQPALDRYVQKMIRKPVWEFWAEISPGVPALEPKMNKPYPVAHDPVGDKNIMYSGHVGHMINLYEMLYRDFKWDQPGAIVFAWSEKEQYVYDNHSLERVMYEQMKNNSYHAICCEPNAVFPECNQHPVLSFLLYDHTHGTKLSEVNAQFLDFFLAKKMISPDTHETAMLYLVKQDTVVEQKNPRYGNLVDLALAPAISLHVATLESPSADGWTGTFMHAWQPEYIERQYPYWKQRWLVGKQPEVARLKNENWEPLISYGFFTMLASEMGDYETRDRLLNFADRQYQPVAQNGTYHYPYNPDRGCTNLTDKLLAFARADPKNGLWELHNRPFAKEHFSQPKISGVDFPKALILRAIYDPAKAALIVSTEGGTAKTGSTGFEMRQLDSAKTYRLFLDGKEIEKYSGKSQISVKVSLDQKHDLVLAAE